MEIFYIIIGRENLERQRVYCYNWCTYTNL